MKMSSDGWIVAAWCAHFRAWGRGWWNVRVLTITAKGEREGFRLVLSELPPEPSCNAHNLLTTCDGERNYLPANCGPSVVFNRCITDVLVPTYKARSLPSL